MADLTPKRLSRSDWLVEALEVLALEGEAELRIDHLAAHLGVTKGSFYWHFENRADFFRQVAEYWAVEYTERPAERILSLEGDAPEKLQALMQLITEQNLTQYDLVVRAWAEHQKAVARIVERADRVRLATLRELFAEAGFQGEELEVRTRLFVVFMSFDELLGVGLSNSQRLERIPLLHQILIRR